MNYIIFQDCPELIKQKTRLLYKEITNESNELKVIPQTPKMSTPLDINKKEDEKNTTYSVKIVKNVAYVKNKRSDSMRYLINQTSIPIVKPFIPDNLSIKESIQMPLVNDFDKNMLHFTNTDKPKTAEKTTKTITVNIVFY